MTRLGVLFLAGVLLFASCGDGSDRAATPTPAWETSTPQPTPSTPATTVDVEVRDGAVVGGAERHEVPLGNEVRLSVRSDVADEVHVHGYDRRVDVPAGGGVLVTFPADVPGVFEVELESHNLRIAELEIR